MILQHMRAQKEEKRGGKGSKRARRAGEKGCFNCPSTLGATGSAPLEAGIGVQNQGKGFIVSSRVRKPVR